MLTSVVAAFIIETSFEIMRTETNPGIVEDNAGAARRTALLDRFFAPAQPAAIPPAIDEPQAPLHAIALSSRPDNGSDYAVLVKTVIQPSGVGMIDEQRVVHKDQLPLCMRLQAGGTLFTQEPAKART